MIRYPEFAGSFYPEDKKQLEDMLEDLFEGAARKKVKHTKAVLSPHAGYIYSGKIAASSYMQLKDEDIETVIILGPSHHYAFYGASIWKEGSWITPLGEVYIDTERATRLLSSTKYFLDDITFHRKEHSIEVQLPFIQYVLGKDVKIVPVVFGFPEKGSLNAIGEGLSQFIDDDKVAFAISSDLYHGYSYDEALRMDGFTRDLIMSMDAKAFYKNILEEKAMACGAMGITAFLLAAEKRGIKPVFIDYTNSAEVTGDYTGYVVGYLSLAFLKEA